jgi:uncharacterized protein
MQPVRRIMTQTGQHFFLFGPRGTGKTTWIQDAFPGAARIDLLAPGEYREFLAAPERLTTVAQANPGRTLVIDEIQRVPSLLPVVHHLIDTKAVQQFVLTGSSARKLRRSGTDLLGGRAAPRTMHPFMAAELGSTFDLAQSLELGMLPVVLGAPDPRAVLRGYAGIYLEQEVKADAAVRAMDSFARFLEVLSFSQGCVLNLSDISRDCQVRRSTVSGYLEVAQDLLMARLLPAFSRRAKRATTVHPKFYYFDCGVYRSLRPTGPLDRPAEADGAALETLVCQHLQAWIDNGDTGCRLHYWRTHTGLEVDFVVYGPATFMALEVKNSATVKPADLRGLAAFCEEYPECSPVLLYRGSQRRKSGSVLCLPVGDFLAHLVPGRPLADAAG